MALESLLEWTKIRKAARPVTSVTSPKQADVAAKGPSLLTCTSVTSVTSENVDRAKRRIEAACTRLSLPADLIGRQFDYWGYSADNLTEMVGWDNPTIEAHARLLLKETGERTRATAAKPGATHAR